MAQSDKIKSEDIIEKGLFDDSKKSADELAKSLKTLEEGLKAVVEVQSEFLKQNKNNDTSKGIKDNTKAISESEKARKGLAVVHAAQLKLEKEQQKIIDQNIKSEKIRVGIYAQEQAASQRAKADLRELIQLEKAKQILDDIQAGTLEKLEANNTILRISRKKLVDTDKDYAVKLKEINSLIDINNDQIKENSDKLKQQKLNVGNYTDSIKDALSGTGLFNGVLGDVSGTLKLVRENLNKASEEGEKFGTKFKIGIAGAIAVGIALIKAAFDDLKEVSQVAQDQALRLNLAFAPGSVSPYIQKMKELRPALLEVSKTLQKVSEDEGDFNDIVNDTSVSLTIRNNALKEASKLAVQRTSLEVEQARLNLESIKAELKLKGSIVGQEGLVFELKQKQVEAENTLSNAIDANSDVLIENQRRERQLFQERVINDIEILRSKKLNADAQVQILQKLTDDETKQIEQRIAAQNKLNKVNIDTQNSEFKIFQEAVSEKIDFNKILLIQDQVLLKNYVRKNIASIEGTVLEEEFFKIVKQAQDNQISNQEKINDLKKEQQQIDERIAEIQFKIGEDARNEEERKRKNSLDDITESIKKNDEKILSGIEAFNVKRIKINENLIKLQGEAEDELFDQKIENLNQEYLNERDLAIKSIVDKEEETKELERIDKKYLIDKGVLEEDYQEKKQLQNEEELERLRKIELKRTQILVGAAQAVTKELDNELDKRNQKEQEQLDKQITAQEEQIAIQTRLAEQGQENTLAIEQARLAKDQLAKKEAEEKAARQKEQLQLVEAYFNAYNARLSKPDANPLTAAGQALGDVFIAKGIAKGLVQFAAEGNNMIEGPGTTTSDSIPFMLSKKEAVIKASENIKHNDAVVALNAGVFDQLYMPKMAIKDEVGAYQAKSFENIMGSMMLQSNAEIKALLKDIADKPVHSFDVDKLGNMMELVYHKGRTDIITYKQSTRLKR